MNEADVDRYIVDTVTPEDDALRAARQATTDAGIPDIAVSAPMGAFLGLLARVSGARRVLEFGTLGGYSAICFARAVGSGGEVVTLELDEAHARVARANVDRADVGDRVKIVLGEAAQSARMLIDEGTPPFDVVFIDADKKNNPTYLELALMLSHSGTIIVIDNVVRGGRVVDASDTSEDVVGVRTVVDAIGRDDRLDATALQTVGAKGWDGFAMAVVR